MAPRQMKRKLAAILSADVKGYSRLMGEDELGTIRTLNAYKKIMATLIQNDRGRVVDAPGDNLLAEFNSIVAALQCAVKIQKELKIRNTELPESRVMEFRIGINLGDVVEEGDKIFGDGVNIAARLESLADGGGICISGTAFDHVENKLALGYEYLGEQTVKNIAKPVRVYRVLMEQRADAHGPEKKPWQWQTMAIAIMIALIVVAAFVTIRKYYVPHFTQPELVSKEKTSVSEPEKPSATLPTSPAPSVEEAPEKEIAPSSPPKPSTTAAPQRLEVALKERMAFPLPDKPSIAVLPFINMSGDPDQEYLGDGLSEEIITALSKIPHLFVIAPNSTFTYKGKTVKVRQVSEDLGVQYVLEGGAHKARDKVRITAQLMDAITGQYSWAERYDRDLKDIFALQDEIAMKIITSLRIKLTRGEQVALMSKGTKNPEAFLKYLQSHASFTRQTKEGIAMGRKLAEEAISLDPKYPKGYIALAQTHLLDILLGPTESSEQSMAKAMELIKKAIALDEIEPVGHGLLGYMYTMTGQHDKAIAEVDRAILLNPNSWDNLVRLGFVLLNAGRPEEAISVLKNARRLNPIPAQSYFVQLTTAYRLTGRYKEAIETAKEALKHVPNNILIHLQLTATYSMMGQEGEARVAAAEVLKINPKCSLEHYAKTIYFKNQADKDRTIEALRKAGLK